MNYNLYIFPNEEMFCSGTNYAPQLRRAADEKDLLIIEFPGNRNDCHGMVVGGAVSFGGCKRDFRWGRKQCRAQ